MSLLAELKGLRGSTHSKKRVGRGDSSGWGGTSGKGHKGQKARSGGRVRWGFEGGQMPIQRRLPKFGFNNVFRTEYQVLNLDQLNAFDSEVTPEVLKAAGYRRQKPFKILGNGKIEKALTVKAHKFSQTAKAAIEAAGGKAEVI